MDSTFVMRESLPTTSTVLRRPNRINLKKTSLETTCIEGRETVYKRRLDHTDIFEVNETVLNIPKRRTNRRLTSVNAMSPMSTVARRQSVRITKPVDRYSSQFMLPPKSKAKRDVIPSYFNGSKTITKGDHKKYILEIMNKGTFKELQILPTIGQKTAFQVMSYRAVNGRFESINDLKNVSAFKGKTYEKFVKVNIEF